MKKFGVFLFTLFISIILAGFYGIIHDQITYSISAEHFTKFKFIQFSIDPAIQNRIGVGLVGFLATWWTGLFIGLGLGLTGLIFKDPEKMLKGILNALGLLFCVAVVLGFIGLLYGTFHLTKTGVDWWLPQNLIDRDRFIIVGSIHNFSYIGGLLGLIAGIFYLIILHVRYKRM